jgi:hypothetical protein
MIGLTWESVDKLIHKGLIDSRIKSGRLSLDIEALSTKNIIDSMTVSKIQHELIKMFNVEYPLEAIEEELMSSLKHEELQY